MRVDAGVRPRVDVRDHREARQLDVRVRDVRGKLGARRVHQRGMPGAADVERDDAFRAGFEREFARQRTAASSPLITI